MNVTCPECATTYRVDPAKVPAAGTLARCARCPASFRVAPDTPDESEAASDAPGRAGVADHEGAIEEPISDATPVARAAGDSLPGRSDSPWPAADASTADSESTSVAGGQLVPEDEVDVDGEVEYVGASDVEFHTEGAAPEDLPYLAVPGTPTFNDAGEVDSPLNAGTADSGHLVGAEATIGSGPGQALDADNGDSPGETPLPPAPFGARSDPHRRAARLARALVSDIVVYHPERRTRSLRQGTLRQEFREEIRKSWEEYANQVGSDFARQTTYFRDALNEILAEGATVF